MVECDILIIGGGLAAATAARYALEQGLTIRSQKRLRKFVADNFVTITAI